MRNFETRKSENYEISSNNEYYVGSENPWDGSDKVKSYSKVIPAESLKRLRLSFIITILLSLFILLFAGNLRAGKVVEKDSDKNSNTNQNKVGIGTNYTVGPQDRDAAEIAEEYAYLLEQLLYLSSDYYRYFADLKDEKSAENYKALAEMCERISQKEQYKNVGRIVEEIAELIKELADRELELEQIQKELALESAEAKKTNANLRALKLTTTLREELESLDQQLEREVIWRIKKHEYDPDAIQHYVTAIVNDSLIRCVSNIAQAYAPVVKVQNGKNGKTTTVVVQTTPAPNVEYIYVPDTPSHPTSAQTVTVPESSTPPQYSVFTYSREMRDSLLLSSQDIEVNILNFTGNVVVASSPNDYVMSSYAFGISSDQSQDSDDLDNRAHLRMYPKAEKVYIESVIPNISDRNAKFIQSRLKVFVPRKNDITISNSNGNISIEDLSNNLNVKSISCNVDIYRLVGDLRLNNSSGTVSLKKVEGNINLMNRVGPIHIYNCEGNIEADNSLGEIVMENCRGAALIRNTGGTIEITDHTGEMEITNRNAQIDIENVKGNLAIFNSFEEISIADVTGDVRVINVNAPIILETIRGRTTVTNSYGDITGIALNGPLSIENKNGDISLDLSRSLSGESSVISLGGDVVMTVSSLSDLLINMEAVGGQISIGGFDSKINTDKPGIATAALSLGKADNTLKIKATGAKIALDRSQ